MKAIMKPRLWCLVVVCVAAWVSAVASQSNGDRGALLDALPLVSDLPAGFRPVGTPGDRGALYAYGVSQHRFHDGDAYHGLPATVAWVARPKTEAAREQGVHYRVRDGRVVGAGYVIRQADLESGRSFYGLSLRGLDLPAAHAVTFEILDQDADGSPRYLFEWSFLPAGQPPPMLRSGELQDRSRLPTHFGVVENEAYVEDFYPRMGRHRRDLSQPVNRRPAGLGSESVWYGEAAGELIFIEYILSQEDLAAGASWRDLPLNRVPIPPIDNVHILHYNGAQPGASGRYTVHMYFLPETRYLTWEDEPAGL